MKFTLEIELGNEAMQSSQDVLDAINRDLASYSFGEASPGHRHTIRDVNGNRVGKWEVTA